jgi:hypothetical protein
MNRKQCFAATAVGLALGAMLMSGIVFGQSVQVPKFQYDPSFPQPLPEKWAIGAIGGMAVDSHDHIWVLHRPAPLQKNERLGGAAMTPPRADCCIAAPPVLEFDQDGKLLASWGGPGEGYDWPTTEHGIFVDAKDNVWLGGNGEKDDQVLKFTTQGKFLAQFGHSGKSQGSADTQNLGGPANLTVDSANNELYVGDGYRNHRVIVIDTETLAFKRMWGAYGNKPDDKNLGPYNPDAPLAQQFRLPHNVALSRDGFVYVADHPTTASRFSRKTASSCAKDLSRRERCSPAPPPGSPSRPISASSMRSAARTTTSGSFCATRSRSSTISDSRASSAAR